MTIFANVKNSLFGAPNEMPSNGMKKVKNEIDTRCFMFRLTFLTLLDILFTINAESRIMTMNNAKAAENEGGSTPIFTIIRAINRANIEPVPAPPTSVYFQFMDLS